MSKIQIDKTDLLSWKAQFWVLYASGTSLDNKHLRLYVSLDGIYKVTKEDVSIYYGQSMNQAIRSFNGA